MAVIVASVIVASFVVRMVNKVVVVVFHYCCKLRKVLILMEEEWQLSPLVNLLASVCDGLSHSFWPATEYSHLARLFLKI